MFNLFYKYCIVPMCLNTTVSTPNKMFICVPKKPDVRRKWLEVMKIEKFVSFKSNVYCCEDHFDIEKDVANLIQYKDMGGPIKLQPGVVPHKFDCQKQEKSQIVGASYKNHIMEYCNKYKQAVSLSQSYDEHETADEKCATNGISEGCINETAMQLRLDWQRVVNLERNERRRVQMAALTAEGRKAFNVRRNKVRRARMAALTDEKRHAIKSKINEQQRAKRAALTDEQRQALNLRRCKLRCVQKVVCVDKEPDLLNFRTNLNNTAIATQKANDRRSVKLDKSTIIENFDSDMKHLFCYTCRIQFLHKHALLEHIALHVTLPSILLSRIHEDKKAGDPIKKESENLKINGDTSQNAVPIKTEPVKYDEDTKYEFNDTNLCFMNTKTETEIEIDDVSFYTHIKKEIEYT